jgi:hypothetical protein
VLVVAGKMEASGVRQVGLAPREWGLDDRNGSSHLVAPCRAEGTRLDTAIRDARLSTPIAGTADLLSSVERGLREKVQSGSPAPSHLPSPNSCCGSPPLEPQRTLSENE